MNTSTEEVKTQRMQTIHTTVRGHEVILEFADEPNFEVAERVKQVLLNSYLSTRKK